MKFAFSREKPVNDSIRFLDLSLKVEGKLCWKYVKPTSKLLASAFRCQLGTVRQAFVKALIRSLQRHSCYYLVGSAMQRQVGSLKSVYYPDRFIS